jgi:threonine/homoserine/homoserine lactone efflux protein
MNAAWYILAKGFGVGLGVAAPIGPVNIEIIRRGLRSGFREAFALGMGAVTADGIYLALVCLGVSRIAEYSAVRVTLLALGVVMLEALGVMALRDAKRVRQVGHLSGLSDSNDAPPNASDRVVRTTSSLRCYGLGMAMMATNPLSMAAWLGFSSIVLGSAANNPMAYVWFALSVPAGCATWVVFISSVLHFGRRFVNVTVLRAVNIVGGLFLCGFGLHLLWQALRG